jgi:hypothetical protein
MMNLDFFQFAEIIKIKPKARSEFKHGYYLARRIRNLGKGKYLIY